MRDSDKMTTRSSEDDGGRGLAPLPLLTDSTLWSEDQERNFRTGGEVEGNSKPYVQRHL